MMTHHWLSHLLLLDPQSIESRLDGLLKAQVIQEAPNCWQVTLGALRMWHRVFFRPSSVGTCCVDPVRANWRAKLLTKRPLRFPFLVMEKAIAPLDMSGLYSSTRRIRKHLMAAHHDKNQFVYDLQILRATPDELCALRDDVMELIGQDTPRHRWLRDLAVYEGYHERLLDAVNAALAGTTELESDESDDPDISFFAYLDWCARQPDTPAATWDAWRGGRFTVMGGLEPSYVR